MRKFVIALVALFTCTSLFAADAPDAMLTAMAPLSAMVGEWEGSGWMKMGPGEPTKFVGQETVTSHLDGRLLTIDGKHWDEGRTRVVHNAFATISPDATTGGYRFRSTLSTGRSGDYTARMQDGAFIWELAMPSGTIRYTIHFDADTWHEVGEMQREGQWIKTFEMTMKRKK